MQHPAGQTIPTYELYGEEETASSRFWVHCETIPARSRLHHWEIGLHRHAHFFQMLSIFAGSGEAIFGKEIVRFEPISIISIPPGVAHGFRFSPDIDGHVFTILASRLAMRADEPALVGRFATTPQVTALDGVAAPPIRSALETVISEWQARQGGWETMVQAGLASALALTARVAAPDLRETESENSRRLQDLADLVQRDIRNHRPASYFAAALGISPTHLNRVVKTTTGLSTRQYLARRLIDEAKRCLLFSGGSIQEIAFRLGYSDPAYFSRFFLRQTGHTPRNWRLQEQARLGTRDETAHLNRD